MGVVAVAVPAVAAGLPPSFAVRAAPDPPPPPPSAMLPSNTFARRSEKPETKAIVA